MMLLLRRLTRSYDNSCIPLLVAIYLPAVVTAIQSPTLGLINTTIYSTHPDISYQPESECKGTIFKTCGQRYDPWEQESYKAPSGTIETYFQTSNSDHHPEIDQGRYISFGFRGSAIYIYGAPRSHLKYPGGMQDICLGTVCNPLDVVKIYAESQVSEEEPVLVWSRDGLDRKGYHRIHFRLREPRTTRPLVGMTFHHLVYTETTPDEPPKWEVRENEKVVDRTYYDTNPLFSYSPSGTSNWNMKTFSIHAGPRYTYHHTSSLGSQPDGDSIRRISWSFQGTGFTVYGVPKSQLQYDPGHSEICISDKCYRIDVSRIYHNVGSTDDPVLLYTNDRLNPEKLATISFRFLQKASPIPDVRKGMTFLKAVISEVQKQITIPPEATFIEHKVLDTDSNIIYLPSKICAVRSSKSCTKDFNPWEIETYPTVSGADRTYHRTSTWINELAGEDNRRLTFTIPKLTSSIKLYGAPRSHLVNPLGKQEVCLNKQCYPIDVDHAYLNIDPDAADGPVLLWSLESLDRTQKHTLTVRLADRTENGVKEVRDMTFSHLLYTEVKAPGFIEVKENLRSTGKTLVVLSFLAISGVALFKWYKSRKNAHTTRVLEEEELLLIDVESPPSPSIGIQALGDSRPAIVPTPGPTAAGRTNGEGSIAVVSRTRALSPAPSFIFMGQSTPTPGPTATGRTNVEGSIAAVSKTRALSPAPSFIGDQPARILTSAEIANLSNSTLRMLSSDDIVATLSSITGETPALPSGNRANRQKERAHLELLLRGLRTRARAMTEEGSQPRSLITSRGSQVGGSRNPVNEVQRSRQQTQLQELAQERLMEEERRRNDSVGDCVICMDQEATISILDCGHLCVCRDCCARLLEDPNPRCPNCRAPVRSTHRIFR